MKNKLDLEILDNSNDDTIEQLSEYDILTDSEKERMFRRSMEIRQDKNKNSEKEIITEKHTGTKEIIINAEHQKKRITNYIAAAAAVILMIGSLRMALNIRNNDDHDISDKAQTGTSTASEETTTVPETEKQEVSDTLNETFTDTIVTTVSEKKPAPVYTTSSITEITTTRLHDNSTEEYITAESSAPETSYTETIIHETPVTSVPVSDTNIPENSNTEITDVPSDNRSDDDYSIIVTAETFKYDRIEEIDGKEYMINEKAVSNGYPVNDILKISATETSAAPGQNIYVDFSFEDTVYLNSICLFFSYDKNALNLTDISLECTDEKNNYFTQSASASVIVFLNTQNDTISFTKDDKIRLYFEVSEAAEEKEYRIDLSKEMSSGLTGLQRTLKIDKKDYLIDMPWKSQSAIINVKK